MIESRWAIVKAKRKKVRRNRKLGGIQMISNDAYEKKLDIWDFSGLLFAFYDPTRPGSH